MGVFIVFCVSLFLALGVLRERAKGRLLRRREDLSLGDLHRSFGLGPEVPQDFAASVLDLVGSCYELPPGKLRPEDDLRGNLTAIDTLLLGKAEQRLNHELMNRHGVRLVDLRTTDLRSLIGFLHGLPKPGGDGDGI